MIISNTLSPYLSMHDIFETVLSEIIALEMIPVKTVVKMTAKKFTQKFSQSDDYTPHLPILSLTSHQVNVDERAQFAWHAVPSPSLIRRFNKKIFESKNLRIYWSPMQLTGTFDLSYIGTSYPQIMDFMLHMQRLFYLQKYRRFTITSSIIIPETVLRELLGDDVVDYIISENILPYVLVPLLNAKRFLVPFKYVALIRLSGESDSSTLFGDTDLPKFMTSLNFEYVVVFPHSIAIDYNNHIDVINVQISFKDNKITKAAALIYNQLNQMYKNYPIIFEFFSNSFNIQFKSSLDLFIPDTTYKDILANYDKYLQNGYIDELKEKIKNNITILIQDLKLNALLDQDMISYDIDIVEDDSSSIPSIMAVLNITINQDMYPEEFSSDVNTDLETVTADSSNNRDSAIVSNEEIPDDVRFLIYVGMKAN